MANCIKTIQASDIEADGLQVRAETSRDHVEGIAELFDAANPAWPDDLPPVVVFHDGEKYWLADGHHRFAAACEAGCEEIRVGVMSGDRTAALWYAVGANRSHGLRRTTEDRHAAVRMARKLDPAMSRTKIAARCGVSRGLVDYVLGTAPKIPDPACPANLAGQGESQIESPESGTRRPASNDGKREEAGEEIGSIPPAGPPPAPVVEDALGRPCLAGPAERAFASLALFAELERVIHEAQRIVHRIGTAPGGELYRASHLKAKRAGAQNDTIYSPDLANALAELRAWKPYTVCPACLEAGATQHDCGVCKGLPYVTEMAFARCPGELRKKVLGEKS